MNTDDDSDIPRVNLGRLGVPPGSSPSQILSIIVEHRMNTMDPEEFKNRYDLASLDPDTVEHFYVRMDHDRDSYVIEWPEGTPMLDIPHWQLQVGSHGDKATS